MKLLPFYIKIIFSSKATKLIEYKAIKGRLVTVTDDIKPYERVEILRGLDFYGKNILLHLKSEYKTLLKKAEFIESVY